MAVAILNQDQEAICVYLWGMQNMMAIEMSIDLGMAAMDMEVALIMEEKGEDMMVENWVMEPGLGAVVMTAMEEEMTEGKITMILEIIPATF